MTKKKWYSYFVVTGEEGAAGGPHPSSSEPRRVADVAADADVDPAFEGTVTGPTDLSAVYASAKIASPAHGYSILKVADMLDSEHIKSLPSDVKRKSILVALDAAGVKVEEVVEDAVRRDRALDTYERVLEKHLEGLRSQVAAENKEVEDEIARQMAELRARVDANRQKIAREELEFSAWRMRKQQEESAIAAAVSYFVSENPITTTGGSAKTKGDADVR